MRPGERPEHNEHGEHSEHGWGAKEYQRHLATYNTFIKGTKIFVGVVALMLLMLAYFLV